MPPSLSPTPSHPRPRLLHGKVAIISGGSMGIGRAIALDYLRHGAHVVINHPGLACEQHALESLQEEARAIEREFACSSSSSSSSSPSFLATHNNGDNGETGNKNIHGNHSNSCTVTTAAAASRIDTSFEEAAAAQAAMEPPPVAAYDFSAVSREQRPAPTLHDLAGDIREAATSAALVAYAVALHGRVDICVANAGVCKFADFLTLPPVEYERTARTNLDGAFFLVQAAGRQMALGGPDQQPLGGSIIGVSSVSALVGGAQQCHYTPTKAGVLSLMQSAACALGKYGIRCNALLPGTIRTRLNEEDLQGEKGKYMEGRIPLGRIGAPRDLAGPAVFLACDELSGYVTGAQLLVDGGLFVNLQ